MRTVLILLAMLATAGCTPVIINDQDHHLLLKVDGMNDGVMHDADKEAQARCAQYNMIATAGTVHKVGWLFPTWYIEYDCEPDHA